MPDCLYRPAWNLPAGVHAFVTTRNGGHSSGVWNTFNLAHHVGDSRDIVEANRKLLLETLRAETGLAVPAVQWLSQVHGTRVFLAGARALPAPAADAIYAGATPLALGVLTADCLPVLLCSRDGREIAVAHAGWRGLLGGVLEAAVAAFHARPAELAAWLGPAIGPCHFEVGAEVRAAFLAHARPAELAATEAAFVAGGAGTGKWLANLYALARIRLLASGVTDIEGVPLCTVCHHETFYSYRKHGVTGRFATLILRAT